MSGVRRSPWAAEGAACSAAPAPGSRTQPQPPGVPRRLLWCRTTLDTSILSRHQAFITQRLLPRARRARRGIPRLIYGSARTADLARSLQSRIHYQLAAGLLLSAPRCAARRCSGCASGASCSRSRSGASRALPVPGLCAAQDTRCPVRHPQAQGPPLRGALRPRCQLTRGRQPAVGSRAAVCSPGRRFSPNFPFPAGGG